MHPRLYKNLIATSGPILNLWINWENSYPNLYPSFTFENEIKNLHKKGWSLFKHNIND